MYQLSSDHRNVYYHARLSCVRQKFSSFNPGQHVRVNKDTFLRLTQIHKDYILKEFGIKFSGWLELRLMQHWILNPVLFALFHAALNLDCYTVYIIMIYYYSANNIIVNHEVIIFLPGYDY